MTTHPTLHKARQKHSRYFAIAVIALLFVSTPLIPVDTALRQIMLWLGYGLVVLGAFGRAYCTLFIGGRKNEGVVEQGPFSVVRNPLYVCSFIALVGIGLQSGMFSILILLVAAFGLYYPLVIEKEEAFLADKFGPAYDTYRSRVPRWIPQFSQWVEPEHVDAMPKFVRHTMRDALMFFVPLPAFAWIAYLHAQEILPVWLSLP